MHIFRNLISIVRKFKLATILNVLGLSVAFTSFILIMMQVDYEVNYNSCYENSERIVRLEMAFDGQYQAVIGRPMAEVLAANEPSVEAMALTRPWTITGSISLEEKPESHYSDFITYAQPDILKVLGFQMLEGDDQAMKIPDHVVIPRSIAEKYYGEESALGKTLYVNRDTVTIGGVYKDFPINAFSKNAIYLSIPEKENVGNWGTWNYQALFLLNSPEAAEHLLDRYADYIDFEAAGFVSKEEFLSGNTPLQFRVTPISEIYFNQEVTYDGEHGSMTWVFLMIAIAVLVVFIAAINYTNFSSSLVPFRIKSINTQKVLGSTNTILRWSLISEGILISLLAFGISLILVYACKSTFIQNMISPDIALSKHIGVIAITAAVCILTGILSGLWPVFYMTSFSPAMVLKGTFGLSPRGRNARRILLCIQFVASIALIINVSFLYLQQRYISDSPLGYDKDSICTTWVSDKVKSSMSAFMNEMRRYSGVEDVAFSAVLLSTSSEYSSMRVALPNDMIMPLTLIPSSLSILNTLGLEVSEGRAFKQEESVGPYDMLFVMNEYARDHYHISVGDTINRGIVLGFVPDIKFNTFDKEISAMTFLHAGSEWANMLGNDLNCCYVRISPGADKYLVMDYLKETILKFDPDATPQVSMMPEKISNAYTKLNNQTKLFTLFGLLAIFISLAGVFGLVSFENAHKRKEIGLRRIFGSSAASILLDSYKQYVYLVAISTVAAIPLSYFLVTSWLKDFAFRTPLYWWVFVLAFLAVTVIILLTVSYQNWKSANENPINSIKSE